jgi:hypothetical protein
MKWFLEANDFTLHHFEGARMYHRHRINTNWTQTEADYDFVRWQLVRHGKSFNFQRREGQPQDQTY